MKQYLKIVPLVLVVAWSAACASQKVPAETALKAAEDAWAPISADAMKFVPDQAKAVSDAIANARASLANSDYAAVIKETTPLPARIADMQKAVAEKKSEFTAAWKTLESTLGSGLVAVQGKIDELLAAKKLPAGIEKTAVEAAKTTLATSQQVFDEAKAAYGNADLEGALAKANQVRAELTKVITDLKLEMPVLAESGKALADSAKETIQETMKKP